MTDEANTVDKQDIGIVLALPPYYFLTCQKGRRKEGRMKGPRDRGREIESVLRAFALSAVNYFLIIRG